MKKIKSIITILLLLMFVAVSDVMAEGEGPGNPPVGPGGGTPIGGTAPIGGGVFVLLGLAAIYGGRKVYQMNKEELEE